MKAVAGVGSASWSSGVPGFVPAHVCPEYDAIVLCSWPRSLAMKLLCCRAAGRGGSTTPVAGCVPPGSGRTARPRHGQALCRRLPQTRTSWASRAVSSRRQFLRNTSFMWPAVLQRRDGEAINKVLPDDSYCCRCPTSFTHRLPRLLFVAGYNIPLCWHSFVHRKPCCLCLQYFRTPATGR